MNIREIGGKLLIARVGDRGLIRMTFDGLEDEGRLLLLKPEGETRKISYILIRDGKLADRLREVMEPRAFFVDKRFPKNIHIPIAQGQYVILRGKQLQAVKRRVRRIWLNCETFIIERLVGWDAPSYRIICKDEPFDYPISYDMIPRKKSGEEWRAVIKKSGASLGLNLDTMQTWVVEGDKLREAWGPLEEEEEEKGAAG